MKRVLFVSMFICGLAFASCCGSSSNSCGTTVDATNIETAATTKACCKGEGECKCPEGCQKTCETACEQPADKACEKK